MTQSRNVWMKGQLCAGSRQDDADNSVTDFREFELVKDISIGETMELKLRDLVNITE